MTASDSPPLRKRLLVPRAAPEDFDQPIDLATASEFSYSSEDAAHPIENVLDDRTGRGGSFWSSGRPDTPEQWIISFDTAQRLSRLTYEVEESRLQRTQEMRVEVSEDGGRTYRDLFVQEYTFSPQGATFQREDMRLHIAAATQLRLTLVPNKSGSGTATMVSLRLYS
jgi:hypothetical protein